MYRKVLYNIAVMDIDAKPSFPLKLKAQQLRLVACFILLFVFTQIAGLVHAEIHAFHEHATSCDLFENLAQPIDRTESHSFDFLKYSFNHANNIELVSVFEAILQRHFNSHAPPFV